MQCKAATRNLTKTAKTAASPNMHNEIVKLKNKASTLGAPARTHTLSHYSSLGGVMEPIVESIYLRET